MTKVDAGDFKHELLNRLRSTMAVNVLIQKSWPYSSVFLPRPVCCVLHQAMTL